MNYLVIAVAGVGALNLVNLWLIVAIARKLQRHSEQLARQAPQRIPRPLVGPSPGTLVSDFSVTTVSGGVISAAELRGERTLIGFFMPGCAPCHDQISAFSAFAQSLPGGPSHTLAVISNGGRPRVGTPERDGDQLAKELAEAQVVQVVRGPSAKDVETAFAVTGYPTFILLSADGRVEAGAHGVAGLGDLPVLAGSA